MVRHGESTVNVAGTHIGGVSAHVPLTPLGVQQSQEAGRRLRDQGVRFAAAYVSTTRRAEQTFAHMGLEGPDGILTAEAVEQSQGDWEGMLKSGVYTHPAVVAAFAADDWGFRGGYVVKGESKRETALRMWNLVECIRTRHGSGEVLLVTHGNAMRYMLAKMFDMHYKHFKFPNASATVIQCSEHGQWSLESFEQ